MAKTKLTGSAVPTVPKLVVDYLEFQAGDICRLSSAVSGSVGQRYRYKRAIGIENPETGEVTIDYIELVEVNSGNSRSIRPEFVILDKRATSAMRKRKVADE